MSYPAPSPKFVGPAAHDSGDGNKPINRIVLHGTVSPCAPGEADDTAAYFRSPGSSGSAHYVVDPENVRQVVFDSRVAWHAPPNEHSLGIEMCDPVEGSMSRWGDKNHRAMLKLTARLVAELCLAYDVPVRLRGPVGLRLGRKGICEHSDVSQAFHQSTHWDLGEFPRRRFLRMVKAEVADLKGQPRKAEKRRRPTRVDNARDLLTAALRRKRINKLRAKRIKAGLDALPKH